MRRHALVAAVVVAGTVVVGAPASAETGDADTTNPFRGCRATPVYAHRGDTRRYTENTGAAVASALRVSGAVEVDVRTAADGTLVLMHDRTVGRTTDGTGPVAGKSWRRLRSYRTPDGLRVPRLARVLRMVRDQPGAQVMLDLKALTEDSARAMVQLVDELRIRRRVSVISFHAELLELVGTLDPGLATTQIFGGTSAPASVDARHDAQLFTRLMSDSWVVRMDEAGVALTARPDDTVEAWRRGIAVGVHAFVANRPRAYLRACRDGRLPDTA